MAKFAVACLDEDETLEFNLGDSRVMTVVEASDKGNAVFQANNEWGTQVEPNELYLVLPLVTVDALGIVHVPA